MSDEKKTVEEQLADHDSLIVVLEKGDNVLCVVSDETTPEGALALRDALIERFPGVSFTVISGVEKVIVQRAEDVKNA